MIEILLTCLVFALVIVGLALGPLFGRAGIQGSCGGLGALPGVESDCGGACKRPCRRRRQPGSQVHTSSREGTG